MATMIFVNLPVLDLNRSMHFFKELGFTFNPQFTDETAACMRITDTIYAMLLTHSKFKEFTRKEIADARKATEVLTCLTFETKDKVNELADKAISAGGVEPRDETDYGFMFTRSFEDPDGHIWELLWMDPTFVNKEAEAATANMQ
jgi:uncharacterized protein